MQDANRRFVEALQASLDVLTRGPKRQFSMGIGYVPESLGGARDALNFAAVITADGKQPLFDGRIDHDIVVAISELSADASALRTLPVQPEIVQRINSLIVRLGGKTKEQSAELLSELEQEIDTLIRAQGPLTGKEICNRHGVGAKVLSNHIVPALKTKRGLKNKRSRGYFYPE